MGDVLIVFLWGAVAITSAVVIGFAGLGVYLLFNFKGIRR